MYEPPQPPLSNRELKIVRGMIDDHLVHELRRRAWWHRMSVGERIFIALASALALIPNILDLILRLERIK